MKVAIEAAAVIYTGNDLIFFDERLKRFLQMDYESGSTYGLAEVDDTENIWGNFGQPIKVGEKIYFPPFNNNLLAVLEDGRLKVIQIISESCVAWKYTGTAFLKNKLYLLPGNACEIICMDIISEKQVSMEEWWPEYFSMVPDECKERQTFGKNRYGNYIIEHEKICVPLMFAPVIMEIDGETSKLNLFPVNNTGGFLAIYKDGRGHKYVLTRSSNQIIEIVDQSIIEIYDCKLEGDTYGFSLRLGNKILILGFKTSQMLVFDVLTKKMMVHDLTISKKLNNDYDKVNYGCMLKISEKEVVVFNKETGTFWKIKGSEDWKKIRLQEIVPQLENVQKIMEEEMQHYGYLTEKDGITLEEFMKSDFSNTACSNENYKSVGTKIIEKMRRK